MKKNLCLVLLTSLATSCVNTSLQPDVVSRSDAQKQQYVVFGLIKDITNVTIEGDREVGSLTGAVIGGAVGNNVTDSDPESDIASVVGALIGSAIGSEIGSASTKKEGVELLIETDAGKFISIIFRETSVGTKDIGENTGGLIVGGFSFLSTCLFQ